MARVPYLVPVPDAGPVLLPEPPAVPGVSLSRSAAADLDQAQEFLYHLDAELRDADGTRAAYLLGLCEAHLANVVEILRGVLS